MDKTINIIELNNNINDGELDKYHYTFILFDDVKFKKMDLTRLEKNKVAVFKLEPILDPMSITALSPHLEYLLNDINGHGILLIHEGKDHYFSFEKDINATSFINSLFNNGFLGLFKREPVSYAINKYGRFTREKNHIIHLSDLHIGKKDIEANLLLLEKSISNRVNKMKRFRFVITGDLKDSPNVSFANEFFAFKSRLDDFSKQETIFVLGNHDVNIKGNVIIPGKREAIDSLGIYPDIKIDDENKLIYILLNSNVEGALLARGKVGKNQLKSLETKYSSIKERKNVADYQKIVMLHHHISIIKKPSIFKDDGWLKKLLYREGFQLLVDAEELINWMRKEDITYVLHGHKHIPNYSRIDNINVISCGSSTGADLQYAEDNKPAISYNVLSLDRKNPCCLIYFVIDEKHQNVIVYPMK